MPQGFNFESAIGPNDSYPLLGPLTPTRYPHAIKVNGVVRVYCCSTVFTLALIGVIGTSYVLMYIMESLLHYICNQCRLHYSTEPLLWY